MEDQTKFEEYAERGIDAVVSYGPQVLLAIVILLIGVRVINRLVHMVVRKLTDQGLGTNLTPFLGSIVGIVLKVGLFLVVAGVLGFDVAAFVGVLAAAGFAVGLALQGSLSNFAAGIIILIFRPYRVGDWVQVPEEYFGQVREIQIFSTILVTPGNKTLIVPNGEVIGGVVTNFSQQGNIRLEVRLLLGYEESFPKIERTIRAALENIPYILREPEAEVGIESFDTHNVVVAVRPFVDPNHYWASTFAVHGHLKSALSAAGIKMAYSEGVELGPIGK